LCRVTQQPMVVVRRHGIPWQTPFLMAYLLQAAARCSSAQDVILHALSRGHAPWDRAALPAPETAGPPGHISPLSSSSSYGEEPSMMPLKHAAVIDSPDSTVCCGQGGSGSEPLPDASSDSAIPSSSSNSGKTDGRHVFQRCSIPRQQTRQQRKQRLRRWRLPLPLWLSRVLASVSSAGSQAAHVAKPTSPTSHRKALQRQRSGTIKCSCF
jgi:hypothetical protein